MSPNSHLEETDSPLSLISEKIICNGLQQHFKYNSPILNSQIKFSICIPDGNAKFPVLFFLPGISSTEQSLFTETKCADLAPKYGFIIVSTNSKPDTEYEKKLNSKGAAIGQEVHSFYVNALKEPYTKHIQMYTYITKELPNLIKKHFPADGNFGIFGHSMGGHGALVCGLRNPQLFKSISTFAPATNPLSWGQHLIFRKFLGEENKEKWQSYDSCDLAKVYSGPFREILLDQGQNDFFLGSICNPFALMEATKNNPKGEDVIQLKIKLHDGFDHSLKLVDATLEDHFKHHSKYLK